MSLGWIGGGSEVDLRCIPGGLEEDWRRIGGGLEVDWRIGGGLEEGWRRIEGGLEEDWRRTFPLGRSNCLQITKNNFLRFWAFYPLISTFHALWRSSSRRTFRDLSIHIKNSSFHGIWLGIQIFDRFSIDFR